MSIDTGKAAVDFLLARSAGRKHMEIDYFGGEPPSQHENRKGGDCLCPSKGGNREGVEFQFTLTTNALLLDEDCLSYFRD